MALRSPRCFTLPRLAAPLPRAVVNVGGISNLTGLTEARRRGTVIGFDIGPGNLLLDHWAQKHFGLPFDRDGAMARVRAESIRTARMRY